MIKKKGFPFEAHKITSEDGYILELHRIPGPENSKPILLVHGMTQSSRDFLMNCGKKALGKVYTAKIILLSVRKKQFRTQNHKRKRPKGFLPWGVWGKWQDFCEHQNSV